MCLLFDEAKHRVPLWWHHTDLLTLPHHLGVTGPPERATRNIQCITFKIFIKPIYNAGIYIKLTVETSHIVKSTCEQKYSYKCMVRKRIKEVISHCQLVITHSFWMKIHKLWTKVLGIFLKSCKSHLPLTHNCKCIYF